MTDSEILRTGVLFKKGSGAGPFGRRNWKPRYFVLTTARLQYYTFEDGELKGELSLQGCDEGVLEVMPADSMKTGSSASTIWRVAINAPERRLLVAAGTEMEMNDWVDKLVLAFRLNAGQPVLQRASMPTSSSSALSSAGRLTAMPHSGNGSHASGSSGVNCNPSIRDFQNFAVPRRGMGQRHSTGVDTRATRGPDEAVVRSARGGSSNSSNSSSEGQVRMQEEDEEMGLQELKVGEEVPVHLQDDEEKEEGEKDVLAWPMPSDGDGEKAERKKAAEQDAAMRRQLALQQQQRQQEEAAQAAARVAAAAAAEEMQRQDEQQQQQQHETMTEQAVASQAAADDVLEQQRRRKREKHARRRAEHEKAVKLKLQLQQEQEQADLAFRLTQHTDSVGASEHEKQVGSASVSMAKGDDDEVEDDDRDDQEAVGGGSVARAPGGGAAAAPRSSLVGDVKREMIHKQQAERHRRREAALKQVAVEQQRVKMEEMSVEEDSSDEVAPRVVEVAPREIEVVRRVPVKKQPAPAAAPMESFEF
ncbi:unnamed protein product [Hyaloperonospora brassicae]|uniref:PH domain-containing protein n=1 Tax=Hyaloperonospora brassicae TaxID=162125 RepID=A0AAV0U1U5_HYABA|nr:unnamed protein product [Hyaloperonospora brassicae]